MISLEWRSAKVFGFFLNHNVCHITDPNMSNYSLKNRCNFRQTTTQIICQKPFLTSQGLMVRDGCTPTACLNSGPSTETLACEHRTTLALSACFTWSCKTEMNQIFTDTFHMLLTYKLNEGFKKGKKSPTAWDQWFIWSNIMFHSVSNELHKSMN